MQMNKNAARPTWAPGDWATLRVAANCPRPPALSLRPGWSQRNVVQRHSVQGCLLKLWGPIFGPQRPRPGSEDAARTHLFGVAEAPLRPLFVQKSTNKMPCVGVQPLDTPFGTLGCRSWGGMLANPNGKYHIELHASRSINRPVFGLPGAPLGLSLIHI